MKPSTFIPSVIAVTVLAISSHNVYAHGGASSQNNTQVCLSNFVDGWNTIVESTNTAIVVQDNKEQNYKLELIGPCLRNWPDFRVTTLSRSASNCLSIGDKIVTNAYYDGAKSCVISNVSTWTP